ncbi:DsbA family protein [Actibacterium ureilyticum]|uniref:DsbA family protein n=1 Tax=Actibacterium ureilyticum TaxID=1590614 RepID=UPI000BAAB3A8|nr:DsbA family protein [Actibacterium ureilyticum]
MIRSTCLALALLLAGPGARAETDGFDARVRAYLLANPEVILEALEVLSKREAQAALEQKLAGFPGLFTDPPRHGLGAPDAPVRVIEFFDYKCAPCKAMHPKLVQLVADNPDLRIEMRHLPILSPASERAARFALATRAVAGADAYDRVHDRLWSLRGPMNAAGFARIAADEGLDFDAIAAQMDSDAITARITHNRDVAIALEILGTPAFVTPGSVRFGQSDIDDLAALWLSR